MNDIIIIDVQGFKIENNKFIVKEFAAYDGTKLCHYIFKPPFSFDILPTEFQQQAKWLAAHHHGLDWCIGFTPLHLFGKIIQDVTAGVKNVYVKGKEKANYIRRLISQPVTEFEESSRLIKSTPKCFYHNNNFCVCALSNVYYLYETFVMSFEQ